MERISRGEIWTIEPSGHKKPRPALVVSINAINDLCPDRLLIPITTKPGPLRIPLSEESGLTGLRMKSYVKCESAGPVHKSRFKKRIGQIPSTDLRVIEDGLKRVFGLE